MTLRVLYILSALFEIAAIALTVIEILGARKSRKEIVDDLKRSIPEDLGLGSVGWVVDQITSVLWKMATSGNLVRQGAIVVLLSAGVVLGLAGNLLSMPR